MASPDRSPVLQTRAHSPQRNQGLHALEIAGAVEGKKGPGEGLTFVPVLISPGWYYLGMGLCSPRVGSGDVSVNVQGRGTEHTSNKKLLLNE